MRTRVGIAGIVLTALAVLAAGVIFKPKAVQVIGDPEDARIVFAHALFGARSKDRPVHVAVNVESPAGESVNVYSRQHWTESEITVSVTVQVGWEVEIFVTQQGGKVRGRADQRSLTCWFTRPGVHKSDMAPPKTVVPPALRVECVHRVLR